MKTSNSRTHSHDPSVSSSPASSSALSKSISVTGVDDDQLASKKIDVKKSARNKEEMPRKRTTANRVGNSCGSSVARIESNHPPSFHSSWPNDDLQLGRFQEQEQWRRRRQDFHEEEEEEETSPFSVNCFSAKTISGDFVQPPPSSFSDATDEAPLENNDSQFLFPSAVFAETNDFNRNELENAQSNRHNKSNSSNDNKPYNRQDVASIFRTNTSPSSSSPSSSSRSKTKQDTTQAAIPMIAATTSGMTTAAITATTTATSFETIEDNSDPPLPVWYCHFDEAVSQDGGNDGRRDEGIEKKGGAPIHDATTTTSANETIAANWSTRRDLKIGVPKPYFVKDNNGKKTLDPNDNSSSNIHSNANESVRNHHLEPLANLSSSQSHPSHQLTATTPRNIDSSEIHILTEAYPVPSPDGVNVHAIHDDCNNFIDPTIPISVEAQPIHVQPWYKHRRTQCLIAAIVLLCAGLAGIVGILFRSNGNDGGNGSDLEKSVNGSGGLGDVEAGTELEALPTRDSNSISFPSELPTFPPSLSKLEGVEADVDAGISELADLMDDDEEKEAGNLDYDDDDYGSLPPTPHSIEHAGSPATNNKETSPSPFPFASILTTTPNPENLFPGPPMSEILVSTSTKPAFSTATPTNMPTSLPVAPSSPPISQPIITSRPIEIPTILAPISSPPTNAMNPTRNPTVSVPFTSLPIMDHASAPTTHESTMPSQTPSKTEPESCITITFTTDEYSHETSWTLISITNANTNENDITDNVYQTIPAETIMASKPFNTYDPNQKISERICLTDGTYRFTLRDQHGDGFGLGSEPYRLFLGNREILFGKFLSSEVTHDIRIGYDAVTNATMTERERQWLVAHNVRRKQWHESYNTTYVPLHWSPELAKGAVEWADQLQLQCCCDDDNGGLTVSGMEGGENIRKTTGKGQMTLPEDVLRTWVDRKMINMGSTGGGGNYPANKDLTQVLWRATKVCMCDLDCQGTRILTILFI